MSEGDEIILITTEGIVIRTTVDTVPVLGRTTSGVKLMNIKKDGEEKVSSFAVMRTEDEDIVDEEGEDDGEGSEET